MPIFFQLRQEQFELEGKLTVREAFNKLGLSLETHLATRDGELLNDNEVLSNGDKITVIAVISGG